MKDTYHFQASAKILKPKCNGRSQNESLSAQSVKDLQINYVWEAYDEVGALIDLNDVNKQKLTIQRGILKPGVYRFKVTGKALFAATP